MFINFSAKPCQRDYSEEKRLQKYMTNVSPKCHDMSQIMIPVSLHYADNVAQPLVCEIYIATTYFLIIVEIIYLLRHQ